MQLHRMHQKKDKSFFFFFVLSVKELRKEPGSVVTKIEPLPLSLHCSTACLQKSECVDMIFPVGTNKVGSALTGRLLQKQIAILEGIQYLFILKGSKQI